MLSAISRVVFFRNSLISKALEEDLGLPMRVNLEVKKAVKHRNRLLSHGWDQAVYYNPT